MVEWFFFLLLSKLLRAGCPSYSLPASWTVFPHELLTLRPSRRVFFFFFPLLGLNLLLYCPRLPFCLQHIQCDEELWLNRFCSHIYRMQVKFSVYTELGLCLLHRLVFHVVLVEKTLSAALFSLWLVSVLVWFCLVNCYCLLSLWASRLKKTAAVKSPHSLSIPPPDGEP